MKSSFTALALSLVAAFGMAEAQAKKDPVTIRVVTPFASGHILADVAMKFKQELEKTEKHITVNVQTSVLNEQSINPAANKCSPTERIGEIVITGAQPIQDYAPQYFFFNGPYVIRDFAHFMNVWDSSLGVAMTDLIEANGNYVALEPTYRGFRQFTSNKAINGPADFQGLKLRLPPTPDWISVWSTLGVTPVQVALPQIYSALQTGVAEASEGDLTQIQSLKLYEVQSHLTMTNHLVAFGLPMANKCFYRNEITKHDRKKIDKAMERASKWGVRTMQERESGLLSQLQAAGMTVVTPDAAAIRAAAEPAINQLFATKWTVTTWQEVLSK